MVGGVCLHMYLHMVAVLITLSNVLPIPSPCVFSYMTLTHPLPLSLSPDPQSWKKRWCVLCRTQDGVSIFYYNKQSSYTNLDVPIGILFVEECRKIFTIPSHPKSRSVFAIDFPYKTVHMYPEKE